MTALKPRACLLALLTATATASAADEADIGAHVAIELNAAQTAGQNGCTLSFLVINGHDKPIETAIYETVIFDPEGRVDRLTLFDFGALPPGRPRVRQFTLPDAGCDAIGRLLINGAHDCSSAGLDRDACDTGLTIKSRTRIEVTG